jgi:hypothetical protein
MKPITVFLALVGPLGAITANVASSEENRVNRAVEIQNVFETVFRHQFGHNESGAQERAGAYFLEIEKKDPAPGFLKRFAGHKPPVKRGSEFKKGEGVKFRIDTYKWVTDNEVELTGGYYEGNLSASGRAYTVVRTDGKWVIEKDEGRGIALERRTRQHRLAAEPDALAVVQPAYPW